MNIDYRKWSVIFKSIVYVDLLLVSRTKIQAWTGNWTRMHPFMYRHPVQCTKPWGLWNPEVQFRILKGCRIIPILIWINRIPRIDTYLYKIHSNSVLPFMPRFFKSSFSVRVPGQMQNQEYKLHFTVLNAKEKNIWELKYGDH